MSLFVFESLWKNQDESLRQIKNFPYLPECTVEISIIFNIHFSTLRALTGLRPRRGHLAYIGSLAECYWTLRKPCFALMTVWLTTTNVSYFCSDNETFPLLPSSREQALLWCLFEVKRKVADRQTALLLEEDIKFFLHSVDRRDWRWLKNVTLFTLEERSLQG